MTNPENKTDHRIVTALTVLSILFVGMIIGLVIGQSGLVSKMGVGEDFGAKLGLPFSNSQDYKIVGADTPEDLNLNFSTFWQVWDILEREYVDKNIDEKAMYEGSIKGMVDSLGDHATSFYTPEETKAYNELSAGDFEGIGAELGYRNGQIIVKTPLKGSPAEEAGIRPEDAILKVDGESTEDMSITDAVFKIRGEAGSKVKLTVIGPSDKEEKDIEVTRGTIHIPSVEFEDLGDGIYHLEINRFTEDSFANYTNNWDRVIAELEQKKPRKLIIDLRANPGGFLDAAPYIASEFLPKGTLILKTQSRDKIEKEYKTTREGPFQDIPIVILVNKGTASASEIFSGAMKQAGRAKIIGESTTGKGTSQVILDDPSWNGATLHITIQKWLLPDGTWLNPDNPIVPDIKVELTREEFLKGRDPQLEKAIETVKEE